MGAKQKENRMKILYESKFQSGRNKGSFIPVRNRMREEREKKKKRERKRRWRRKLVWE